MTWPAQTVTNTLNALGHVILRYNVNLTSVTTISRVTKITALNLAPEIIYAMHYGATGQERRLNAFQVAPGQAAFSFTLDEIYNPVSAGWISPVTPLVNLDIRQFYPKNPSRGWQVLFASACIIPKNLTVPDYKKQTEVEYDVIPMGASGTETYYTFDTNSAL